MNRRRSEEHTSELQSPCNLVCRLLLQKKNNQEQRPPPRAPARATGPAAPLARRARDENQRAQSHLQRRPRPDGKRLALVFFLKAGGLPGFPFLPFRPFLGP